MDALSNEELRNRIKQIAQSERSVEKKKNLIIEETEDGFRIDTLICTGFPKAEASTFLLLCYGLTREECASTLNKSVSAVSRNIHSICLKLLGSDESGDPDGNLNAAVVKAFNWAYLYHVNTSAFRATKQEWDLLITQFRFLEKSVCESSRLVFVEGMSIEAAVEVTCADLKKVNLAVRNIEQIIGQSLEKMERALG